MRAVEWEEIAGDVAAYNEDLAEALTQAASVTQAPVLFAVKYPYGALIAEDGQLVLPCAEASSSCPDCSLLRDAFGGGSGPIPLPVAFVLENIVEVFVTQRAGPQAVPLNLLGPGTLFGVFEESDRIARRATWSPWKVSSGARCVKILAPLLGEEATRQINDRLHVQHKRARSARSDWGLIKYVIDHLYDAGLGNAWRATIILVPPQWLQSMASWPLRELCLRTAWDQSSELRQQGIQEFNSPRGIAPGTGVPVKPYLYATLQHLIAIARGSAPAFSPVRRDGPQHGPFTAFQRFIVENQIGTLTKRDQRVPDFPHILQPSFVRSPSEAVYYSVTQPSLLYPYQKKDEGRTHEGFLKCVRNALVGTDDGKVQPFLRKDDPLDLGRTQFLYPSAPTRHYRERRGLSQQRVVTSFVFDEHDRELIEADFAPRAARSNRGLNLRHDFFQACIRIVRCR